MDIAQQMLREAFAFETITFPFTKSVKLKTKKHMVNDNFFYQKANCKTNTFLNIFLIFH